MAILDPSALSAKVKFMQTRAKVCQDLMGGTPEMRSAGKTYLPQWPQEDQKGWEARRDCSALFPALERAIETMIGKPFGVPIVAGEDVPARVEAALDDVDRAGRDIDSWARDVARAALVDGITWALADYPRLREGATRADEIAIGAEPYLIHIPLASMLGWKTRRVAGKTMVSELRYKAEDEETGMAYVYVWTPGEVKAYFLKDSEWVLDPLRSGVVSLKTEIPVVVFYGKRMGTWQALPPLEAMAYLNIQHWQSSSDQRHILHVARVPLLAADEDNRQGGDGTPVALGTDGIMTGFKNLRYVETTGASIEAGEKDIERLEDQMRRCAGEMLQAKAGDKTATENNRESLEGSSQLRAFVWTFQDALEECLRYMALWIGEKDGGSLTVNTEWDEGELASDLWAALNGARTAGLISQEVYTWNLQKGRRMPPDRTVEDEKASLDLETPPMVTGSTLPTRKPKKGTITRPDGSQSTVVLE